MFSLPFFRFVFFPSYECCCTFSFLYPSTLVFIFFPLFCFLLLSFLRYKWRERTRLGSSIVAAPQPTAIQQHHNNSSRKRARVCLCERGKFATQTLFSVQVMPLGSTNREVNMTAGEVLFLERLPKLSNCIISSRQTTTEFTFLHHLLFFCAHHKGTKPTSESHSMYVPQAQQNSLQSALDRAAKYTQ